jgi:hypothetical protein
VTVVDDLQRYVAIPGNTLADILLSLYTGQTRQEGYPDPTLPFLRVLLMSRRASYI